MNKDTRLIVGVSHVVNSARKKSDGIKIYCLNDMRLWDGGLWLAPELRGFEDCRGVEARSKDDWLMMWDSDTSPGLLFRSDSTIVVTVLSLLSNGRLPVELEVRAMWSSSVNLNPSLSLAISIPIKQ